MLSICNFTNSNLVFYNKKSNSFIIKRFMLSRCSPNITQTMPLHNKQQVAHSALNFSKLLVNKEFVHNIGVSSQQNIANEHVVKKVFNYVSDTTTGGTSTIKTNFMAAFMHHNKELMYSTNSLEANINHPRIKIDPSLLNKLAPSRTLVELPIMINFVNRMPQVKQALYLVDQITLNTGTKNTNPDFKITFNNLTSKAFDIKTAQLDTHVFSGEIREIAFTEMQMVTYPRDFTKLTNQYELIEKGLLIKKEEFKKLWPTDNYTSFWNEFLTFQRLFKSPETLLNKHQQMENALMNITQDPYFNYNINFYNIYHIKNGLLTQEELKFLEEAANLVDSNILTKPSYMNQYLINCLHIYHKKVDPFTYETLVPLRKVYPFIKELLKNYIGND